ncbi:hypothetical protein R3P38DRAFT_3628152, partial [Favolaschia claudopus]
TDYRRIPWGDVYLQHQIHTSSRQWYTVRLCSARINNQSFTVVNYEGNEAEQEWKKDVRMYMEIRHEKILQIYGIVRAENVYATIFHGVDYITFDYLLDLNLNPPMRRALVIAYYVCHLTVLLEEMLKLYVYHSQKSELMDVEFGYTTLIHCTTGRLCLDIGKHAAPDLRFGPMPVNSVVKAFTIPSMSFLSHVDTNLIVQSLTLEDYHRICREKLSNYRRFRVPSTDEIHVGSVCHIPDYSGPTFYSNPVGIAYVLPKVEWDAYWSNYIKKTYTYITPEGWTCRPSEELSWQESFEISVRIPDTPLWLSQANHIFRLSAIKSNFRDYVLITECQFRIHLEADDDALWEKLPPGGYLFVCPTQDFRGVRTTFKWPECPAYWSLDPSGVERLSMEQASELGFPAIYTETWCRGFAWDDSVYAGLREFHQTKGFDPDSQDVARHLGYPLYQLTSDTGESSTKGRIEEIASDEEGLGSANQESTSAEQSESQNGNLRPTVDGASTASKEREQTLVNDSDQDARISCLEYNGQEPEPNLQESIVDLAERMPVSRAFKAVLAVQIHQQNVNSPFRRLFVFSKTKKTKKTKRRFVFSMLGPLAFQRQKDTEKVSKTTQKSGEKTQ